MLEIAEKRGLPLAFPLLDTEDLQSVTFSDIWGGFDERIIAASKRYGANSILIGRVRPSSSQSNRWTYISYNDNEYNITQIYGTNVMNGPNCTGIYGYAKPTG